MNVIKTKNNRPQRVISIVQTKLIGALILIAAALIMFTPQAFSHAASAAQGATATLTPANSATPVVCPPPSDLSSDPHALLNCATQGIERAKDIKIKLQVSGAPAIIIANANMGSIPIQFLAADGEYVAPDAVHATVKAKLAGIAGQVEVVAIGDDQWYRNAILTANKFVKATFSAGFKPANLVSSDLGIQSALQSVANLTFVGKENVFGQDVYHLSGIADGAKVTSLTVGLITSKASVNLDIYLDIKTLQAVEIVVVQPETVSATQPDPTRWDLELFDYDVDVQVTPPPNAIVPPTPTVIPVTQVVTATP
jgi:hypothetical protein